VFRRSVTSGDPVVTTVLVSTAARSRERWSGAATTKPHWARWLVRKLDCSGKLPKPWLNRATGNDVAEWSTRVGSGASGAFR